MKIDEINSRIIKELLNDGRKTFTEIAQVCNTSKEVIANRYRQMRKEGIIVGATIQNSCACYACSMVAYVLINTELQKVDNVVRLLSRNPRVIEIFRTGINPSVVALLVMKDIQELDQAKQSMKQLPFVSEVDTRILIGVRNTPHNLSVIPRGENGGRTVGIKNMHTNKGSKIDETDKFIIEKLAIDSRMPFSNIAKELKVSTAMIARRYEGLKENGHLKAVVQINPIKLGYGNFAVFNLTFSQDSLPNGIDRLSRIPDVNFIHKISGKYDCVVSLMIKDIDQFTAVQEEIVNMSGLTNMEVALAKLFTVWPRNREFISTF